MVHRWASPFWGLPQLRKVEGQGGQNQLYERSTENDVFQMKAEKKTENPAADLREVTGRRPEPYEQKTEEGYILKPLGGELKENR